MKKILSNIREVLVICYELSIFIVPFVFFRVCSNHLKFNILGTDIFPCLFLLFLYYTPALCHCGVFGDRPKGVMDKIMGYNGKETKE